MRIHTCTLLLALLLATACDDGEQSGGPTPAETTTSATTTVTPEPDAWKDQSRSGAKTFLERYVQIEAEMFVTGDTEPFRALALSTCQMCNAYVTQIEEVYAKGGRITTVPSPVIRISVKGRPSDLKMQGTLILERTPITWVRRRGAAPQTYREIQRLIVGLQWVSGRWKISSR